MTTASSCSSENCAILISLVIIVIAIGPGVKCTSHIQLQSDAELVLNQPVQYECTVSGSTVLTMRIIRDDGFMVGSVTYVTIINQPARTIGSFTIMQSPGSIAGRISFTVESNIVGYTIICEDGLTMENDNITISLSSLGQQVTTNSVIMPTTSLTTTTSVVPEPFVTLANAILSPVVTSSLHYTPSTVTSSFASGTSSHSSVATSSPSIPVESAILCTLCPVESTESLSSLLLVAGISVAITVPVTAIITAIITIIIMYLLCIKHNKQSEEVLPNNDYETPVELDVLTRNLAYGQVRRVGDSYEGQSDAFKIYY